MSKVAVGVIYALVMIAVIVGVDLLFLREQPAARLIINIGIVLAFGLVYLKFIRSRP